MGEVFKRGAETSCEQSEGRHGPHATDGMLSTWRIIVGYTRSLSQLDKNRTMPAGIVAACMASEVLDTWPGGFWALGSDMEVLGFGPKNNNNII